MADEQKQKEMEEWKNRKREWRQEIAAKNKELKRIKKEEKNKQDKKELWARLREINATYAKIKESKKQHKNKKEKLILEINKLFVCYLFVGYQI